MVDGRPGVINVRLLERGGGEGLSENENATRFAEFQIPRRATVH